MRVLFLERATRSGHTGYVAILHTVAIAPSENALSVELVSPKSAISVAYVIED
jgi:hypothetical protein